MYIALLHHRKKGRYEFLRHNSEAFAETSDESLELMLSSLPLPKMYNESLAKYAVLVDNETKPVVLCTTREKAWHVAFKKAERGAQTICVVDVPLTEMDDPQSFRYNVQDRIYHTEIVVRLDDELPL